MTNGTSLLIGINPQSERGRRYRDLIEDLTAQLGGNLDPALQCQVRNAAAFQLRAEELTAALVRGEAVDPEEFTRANNSATRATTALRRIATAQTRARDEGPTLEDLIAEAAE